ncbi:LLM class flavin-dependent oxidoreductase [Mycolicibacterium sp.]|uniref:LLM class flavin-dependent oxidoreductase n=1 Tax=Mycolicibacterium sp. TaxID=2320850 RepID=UPI001A29EC87|nr:LLM class flavin-dependent oxidoreductase [Mycolicibacterium sp.]MBJ7338265.1 LLM class flavin-dependent oxidoreductase [Mycolicibacterium sp.]
MEVDEVPAQVGSSPPRAQVELPAPRAKFFWFLPTSGDSRSIVASSHASSNQVLPPNYRPPTRRYLAEVARAADRLGFEGVLTPTGTWCEDAWLTSAALLAETDKLKFLVAFRPGLVPPTLAAQQAATLQRFSEGRVLLNIVTGGDDVEQRRFGDWLDHDQRYARTGEFLHVVDSVWRGDGLDFRGDHYTVADARVSAPPDPLPQIYFGGSSPAALPIAAQYVDVYLTWGEPPQAAAAKIARVRELAEARGRNLRFGIRLHTISRDTSAAAWAVADELVSGLSEEQIAKQTALHSSSQSEGQRRMTALHGGRLDRLEIYPNLWAGVGLVRGGAGTALVGSHQEVADLIYEYHSLGFDEFILSGYPHLEEAHWFAEGVLPLLRHKGVA